MVGGGADGKRDVGPEPGRSECCRGCTSPGDAPWQRARGVRVIIHPQTPSPSPSRRGYDVPPGYSASFGIRPRMNIRIGPPHGNCIQSNPFSPEGEGPVGGGPSGAGERYQGEAGRQRTVGTGVFSCQKMCIQSHVIKECKCYDASLPKLRFNSTTKPCRRNDELPDSCMLNATDDCLQALLNMSRNIQCEARTTRDNVTRNTTLISQCLCYPPCDEFLYDVSYRSEFK